LKRNAACKGWLITYKDKLDSVKKRILDRRYSNNIHLLSFEEAEDLFSFVIKLLEVEDRYDG